MHELSLHILDIVQNSINAEATMIKIDVIANKRQILIKIVDNGKGMKDELTKIAADPFVSTANKKIGLGLSLLKQASERAGGEFFIESKAGVGTTVTATFERENIDRMPIGNISNTIASLIDDKIDFLWTYVVDDKKFLFDTKKWKEKTGEAIDSVVQVHNIRAYVEENIERINGGIIL